MILNKMNIPTDKGQRKTTNPTVCFSYWQEEEKEERTEDESIPQDLKINPLGHERWLNWSGCIPEIQGDAGTMEIPCEASGKYLRHVINYILTLHTYLPRYLCN